MTPPNATTPRKRLIEVSIPLEAINKASAREKSIRHGHPSTLHLWWARRPLAACRAVLFAQLVDDPSAWPDRFPTEAAQDEERRRLHKVIEDLVPWEASNDEVVLTRARYEIARSVAWRLGEPPPLATDGKAILTYLQEKAPPIYDPFCGGGSIPLEAQRLGLRAYGSDLNPVAVLISKGLVEIPTKFAGLPPVNPEARAELARPGARWNGRRGQGLAEDVRYYGKWMRDQAEKRIGHLYPKARLPDDSEATVIAWLWARTVRSPDPAAKGAMVPLVSSFMLSTKEGKKTWVEVILDSKAPDGWRFEVKAGTLSKTQEDEKRKGTRAAKAQAFVCALTKSPIDRGHIQVEGKEQRLGIRLMAIVGDGHRGRIYLSASDEHEAAARRADQIPIVEEARSTFLSPNTPTRAMITGGVCSAYGLVTWGHLFTPRQLVALTTFTDLVAQAREKALSDALVAGLRADESAIRSGGTGATAYADAIGTYLAFAISKCANIGSSIATWMSDRGAFRETFARQAIPMTWDFAEANSFADAGGSFVSAIEKGAMAIAEAPALGETGIFNIDAAENTFPVQPVAISTDPPYYDNIGYADLSDFFYVWLRRSLVTIWPDLFRRITTPKAEELVATTYRHGSKEAAERFFLDGMRSALTAMRNACFDDAPLTVYYAFKQSEIATEGVTSAGWASFLQAIIDCGLAVDGTWPVRTESAGRIVGLGTNALASSIVLVCRKPAESAPIIGRADFIRALKRELPAATDDIRQAGVGPVDMEQAVIGPGMGIFSRYRMVREDDDSPMSVRTALALINRAREELASDHDASYDPETQVALAWFTTYGFDVGRTSGEAIMLAQAKNTSLDALFSSGVFKDERGKTRLMKREEMPTDWTAVKDRGTTVWECVQQTARVLSAEDGGQMAAARLVKSMGAKGSDALALAYRLYDIANTKGQVAEARIYAELAAEWPTLEAMAQEMSQDVLMSASAQGSLL